MGRVGMYLYETLVKRTPQLVFFACLWLARSERADSNSNHSNSYNKPNNLLASKP